MKKKILIPTVIIIIMVAIGTIVVNNKREPMPIYELTMGDLINFNVNDEYDDGFTHAYYLSNGTCSATVMYNSKDNFVKMISFSGNDKNSAYSKICLKAFGDITKNPKLIAQNDETKDMVLDLASSFVTKKVDETNIEQTETKNKVRFVFLDKEYQGDHDLKYQLKVTRDYNSITKKAEDFNYSIEYKEE